ncbi:hypothetical protein MA20_32000 [Bradyrhizobium japonicum]|uniref:Uncharacterized protein n=1 Tax=Bradyrhizobium japonicum TaxID=375 RepID=A0A0A3XN50_BRAJP|nr:ASCH domain-containing protein [Bradyrhizobium japonicum]KGT75815.1 hypothetical protein MA20_32000 [Bradyrhizobium japonicum]
MKAISLWQPWASLIAVGAKPFETRHWAPPRELIGKRIAIHAAKKVDKYGRALAEDVCYGQEKHGGVELADKVSASIKNIPEHLLQTFGMALLPVGCIVCTAKLDAAFQLGDQAQGTARPAASVVRRIVSRSFPDCFTVRYDNFGDYKAGRWAWLLSDIAPIVPTGAVVGRQGFFEVGEIGQ